MDGKPKILLEQPAATAAAAAMRPDEAAGEVDDGETTPFIGEAHGHSVNDPLGARVGHGDRDGRFDENQAGVKEENPLVAVLCCPVRLAVALTACLLTCVCCPLMFCCELGMIALFRCCCNPSLATMEAIFGRPLWELVLVRADKMDSAVYEICTTIFSRYDFEPAAMRLFEEVDQDQSGLVDATELENLISRIPANVALTDTDIEDISSLYRDYTGSKTRLSRKDWPIFIRAVMALIIANAVLIHRMERAEIIIIGFTGDGRTTKEASADKV